MKCLLHRMELAAHGEPFDRCDLGAFGLDSEHRARLRRRPSIRTVHAPHELVSQPMFVPVRSSSSRKKCANRVRGSTSAERDAPLIVTVTSIA